MTMTMKIFYLTIFVTKKKDIIQNKCHIYTSYRLVWRLLLRQITLSLSNITWQIYAITLFIYLANMSDANTENYNRDM